MLKKRSIKVGLNLAVTVVFYFYCKEKFAIFYSIGKVVLIGMSSDLLFNVFCNRWAQNLNKQASIIILAKAKYRQLNSFVKSFCIIVIYGCDC